MSDIAPPTLPLLASKIQAFANPSLGMFDWWSLHTTYPVQVMGSNSGQKHARSLLDAYKVANVKKG